MPKYIDADAFVKEKREWYCEQCEKRKGMKRGRLQFVYEIGDAPCLACYIDDMIYDIEDFPAADVEPKRKGAKLYTAHEVAVILAEAIGDDCACNVNGNDEWLSFHCDFRDTVCPDVCGVACWEQFLKHLDKKPKEADNE